MALRPRITTRVVRELMDREVDLRNLEALRKRFDYVLGRICQAHIENGPRINNNNNNNNPGHNNRTQHDKTKTPAHTPPTLPVAGSIDSSSPWCDLSDLSSPGICP